MFEVYGKIDSLISKINKEQKFEDSKSVFLGIMGDNKDEFIETFKETKDDLVGIIKETKFGKFFSKFSKNKSERG